MPVKLQSFAKTLTHSGEKAGNLVSRTSSEKTKTPLGKIRAAFSSRRFANGVRALWANLILRCHDAVWYDSVGRNASPS
jgi:hypothetical protein